MCALIIESSKNLSNYSLICSRLSTCHDQASGHSAIQQFPPFDTISAYRGPTYDSSGILRQEITYFPSRKTFMYKIHYWGDGGYSDDQVKEDLDIYYQPISGEDSYSLPGADACSGNGEGRCVSWAAIAPTDFPPIPVTVEEPESNPNTLQVHLSSNPIASNTEAMITLRDRMKVQMQIMDILGHIIFSEERMLSAGINSLPINSSKFASGIYICRLQAGGEVVSLRFVKE